jgi:hypothetical protein
MTDDALLDKPERPPALDFGLAFTFVANQPFWIRRLLILLTLGAASTLLLSVPLVIWVLPLIPEELLASLAQFYPELQTYQFAYNTSDIALIPLWLVGLGVTAVLLGYYVEITRRVRRDLPELLPAWEDWGRLFNDGAKMIVVYFVYFASDFALFVLGLLALRSNDASMNAALTILFVTFCCLVPLLVAYGVLIIFMMSICVVRYSESGDLRDFFAFGWVWSRLRQHGKLTIQWFIMDVGANLGFSATQSLPVVGFLGWLLTLAMQFPVQGHLLGQYARLVDAAEGYTPAPIESVRPGRG